jgi:hypothetical protein
MDPQACYDRWVEAEDDAWERRELREAYNAWRAKGGYAARDESGAEVDRLPIDEVEGQDPARGILAVNPHGAGTEEGEAWALGYDYAVATEGVYESPLSGEWSDQLTPAGMHARLSERLGYELGDAAFDEVDDAFELGYVTYVSGWRV